MQKEGAYIYIWKKKQKQNLRLNVSQDIVS